MRHTTHIMLGDEAGKFLLELKKYAIKYSDEVSNRYFNAMLYTEKGKDAVFSRAVPVAPDTDKFVSGIDELYKVKLEEDYKIPQTERAEYLRAFFSRLYNGSITINDAGDSTALNVCFYLPLYKPEYWTVVEEFLSAMESLPQQFHVDLFLLPYDIAFLYESDKEGLPSRIAAYEQNTSDVLKSIIDARPSHPSLSNLVLIQNCNSDGLALGLDENSYTRILGEYAILAVGNYREMFPVAAQDAARPVHALGLSVLSFDKYYYVQYLLHKAYVYILEREKVSQAEVDVNKVSQIVQKLLVDNVKIFSRFYDKEVTPLLNDNVSHADIISRVGPKLTAEMDRLTVDFQSYVADDELSLPEKEATLAQLLGEDDELLVGYMFNKKQLVIDDCSREVLDFFVDANNKLCVCKAEENDDADKQAVENIKDYAALSRGGEPVKTASQLLDELKETKVSMRESSNYIRQKTKELESLDVQVQQRKDSYKRLTDEGFVFGGKTYKLQADIQEEIFEEDYKPMTNISANVDLSKSFTPIKDQGDMGACSAFAAVSIFEYILKKNRQPDVDLSEQFVYYCARKSEGVESLDAGSSLYSVMNSMAQDGVCLEKLFPYNPANIDAEPSQEAVEDASTRKVKTVLNVKRDVNDIRSAICEGYPVAISLKLYDSFNPVKGFIPMPGEEEISAGTSGNHAMVIVGYDNENQFFKVRNSWGRKFGDKGYCYLPYSYISDERLLNSACIIKEVSDTQLKVIGTDSKTTISFDLEDSSIKSEILANLIRSEKIKLTRLTRQLTERSRSFNLLFQNLGNNSTRESISDGTCERLDWECRHLEKDKAKLHSDRTEELNDFDDNSRRFRIYFWASIGILVLTYILICVFSKSLEPLVDKVSLWVYGFTALGCVAFWLIMRRRKRQREDIDLDYKDRIERISVEISNRQREKETMHLRSHLSGMIIDSLYKLGRNLHSKFNGMRSYVGNLKVWEEQELESLKMRPLVRDPFLTLITNECLDRYFEERKEEITSGMQLSRMFENKYKVEEAEIIKFKNTLKNSIVQELFKSVEDFSIFNYLVADATYPYIDNNLTNTDSLLMLMDKKSQPFFCKRPSIKSSESINTFCKMIFIDADEELGRAKWEDAVKRDFEAKPVLHRADNSFKVTLLQLSGQAPEDLSILK